MSPKEYVNYDFGTYLSGDSDFEKNITAVMPAREELKKSKIIYYMYYDNGSTNETSECKMIRLTVEYFNEDFTKAVQAIEEHSELYYDETMSRQFYYNGVLYNGFILYNNGYCALAYHVCSDSNTISYLAFDCWDLQFMDVESALENFPQFESENQIKERQKDRAKTRDKGDKGTVLLSPFFIDIIQSVCYSELG